MLPAIVITPDGNISKTSVPPRLAVIIGITKLMTNPDAAWVHLGPLTFIPYKDVAGLTELLDQEIKDAETAISKINRLPTMDEDDHDMIKCIERLKGWFVQIRALCDDAKAFDDLDVMEIEHMSDEELAENEELRAQLERDGVELPTPVTRTLH